MKTPGKPSSKKQSPVQQREAAIAALRKQAQPVDPLAQLNPRALALRVGLPALVVWAIAFALSGWWPKIIAAVISLVIVGVILWVIRFAKRTRAVAQIVQGADTAEARKDAISKLETDFKKDDSAAIFAKAQLQMQEDPREALRTLEAINLEKVMAPTADEARVQRAMIHLILGETDEARALVDKIDMSRHKEPKVRAMMSAIVGEAWARTGQAKKAVELLETFDPADGAFAELKPQLLRARAFAYAWANNTKQMKHTLRSIAGMNPQYLGSFITRKKNPMGGVPPRGVHPMLEKEAFDMLMQSGAVSRKVQMKRS
jgi:Tetratricopeptide repeat